MVLSKSILWAHIRKQKTLSTKTQWNTADLPNTVVEPHVTGIRLLWHSDYYDGPLSGMCQWQGEQYWFEMADEEDDFSVRYYHLIKLTPPQREWQECWHQQFQKYVGTVSDYDVPKVRASLLQPQDQWDKFYKPYMEDKAEHILKKEQIVGWFDSRNDIVN